MLGALGGSEPLYYLAFIVLIVFFCFFYVSIIFNPNEAADNMRKYGGFIPGIRPGQEHGRIHGQDSVEDHRRRRLVSVDSVDHSQIMIQGSSCSICRLSATLSTRISRAGCWTDWASTSTSAAPRC